MDKLKIDTQAIINAYNEGQSLHTIATTFGTYATSIKRILKRNGVVLRHDFISKGELYVKDGEKLIEWAKKQKRLVTKAELAEVIGKKRLSPSYFIKYPELGQYIQSREQQELRDYSEKLYRWLQENHILYKPNDRTKLKISITALLLGEYENLAIQLNIKPKCMSVKQHTKRMKETVDRAMEAGITTICIDENYFKHLDILKSQLDELKSIK